MRLFYINIEQAKEIHRKTVEVSGGGDDGILDIGKLESVLDHFQNDDYYPDFVDKLTHLFFCSNKFHCFSDEFNSTSFDYSQWNKLYCCTGHCYGESAMHPNNVLLDGSELLLKVDSMIDPYAQCPPNKREIWSAGIYSKNNLYPYGYLEI